MSYQQNEAATLRRLEQRCESLRNQRDTDEIEIARLSDRVRELERQLEAVGDYNIEGYDQIAARCERWDRRLHAILVAILEFQPLMDRTDDDLRRLVKRIEAIVLGTE